MGNCSKKNSYEDQEEPNIYANQNDIYETMSEYSQFSQSNDLSVEKFSYDQIDYVKQNRQSPYINQSDRNSEGLADRTSSEEQSEIQIVNLERSTSFTQKSINDIEKKENQDDFQYMVISKTEIIKRGQYKKDTLKQSKQQQKQYRKSIQNEILNQQDQKQQEKILPNNNNS